MTNSKFLSRQNRCLTFISVLLLFLCELTVCSTLCSRSLSRLARQRIESGLVSYISHVNSNPEVKQQVQLSSSCPLANDMYQTEYEDRLQDGNSWRCLLCGKLFQAEEFLDAHVFRKHSSEPYAPDSSANCLADNCDWLRCDVISAPEDLPYWKKALCDRNEMNRKRNKCVNALKTCIIGADLKLESEIFEFANNSLCSFLTCENYWDRDHIDMTKLQSFFKVAGATLVVLVVFCYYILVLQMYCEGEVSGQNEKNKNSAENENLKLEMPMRFGDVQNVRKRNAHGIS